MSKKLNKKETSLLSSLIIDDRCKNEEDVYQIGFYKVGFKLEKIICQNTEKNNCNKFRIYDLRWLKDKKTMELPDILIIGSDVLFSLEELEIVRNKNIQLIEVTNDIFYDEELFDRKLSSIERIIYKTKTSKCLQKERELVNNIEEKYLGRINDVELVTNTLIYELLILLKDKDLITYDHVNNVSKYVDIFLKGMPENEKLNEEEIKYLKEAALVHDIGKLIIPNQILKKKGLLNKNEYHDIKKHVAENAYLFKSSVMEKYKEIALCHHERYDGNGYPYGLKGEEIPIGARIIAILDAFDAMTGNREYVNKKTLYEALNDIKENMGKQFDPKLANYFINGVINNQMEICSEDNKNTSKKRVLKK